MAVWELCVDIYLLECNMKLAFPAGTDPTKTYQWRYAKAIAAKFDEWNFDEQTSKKFITIAVQHCKQVGCLRKGLAALHQSNLLKICYDKLQMTADSNESSIQSIKTIHQWLSNKFVNNDPLRVLLYRNDPDELCNLVKWFQASRISRLYLSLSKTCSKAIARLAKTHPEERELLPKTTTLYLMRVEFLENQDENKIKQVLGQDWRELCL